MDEHSVARGLIAIGAGVAQQETTDRMPAAQARYWVAGFGALFAVGGAALKILGPKRATWPDTVGDPLLDSGLTMLAQAGTNLVDAEVLKVGQSGGSYEELIVQVPAGETLTPPALPAGATSIQSPTFVEATAGFDSFEVS